jgi:hypothetical protein
VQDLHEVGGAELSGSTRGLDLLRQPHGRFFPEHHKIRPNTFRLMERRFAFPQPVWISGGEYRRP